MDPVLIYCNIIGVEQNGSFVIDTPRLAKDVVGNVSFCQLLCTSAKEKKHQTVCWIHAIVVFFIVVCDKFTLSLARVSSADHVNYVFFSSNLNLVASVFLLASIEQR